MRDLFAFAYVQFVHVVEQIQSVVRPERCLLRINDIVDFDPVLGKKLLRLRAGRSTSPMIAPIYVRHCEPLVVIQCGQSLWPRLNLARTLRYSYSTCSLRSNRRIGLGVKKTMAVSAQAKTIQIYLPTAKLVVSASRS
jgi:hypothetical protein